MKLTVTKGNLKLAISKALTVVSSKVQLPILTTLLLEADGDTLCITASDNELSLRTTVAALVFESGSAALPAHALSAIVGDLPSGDVTLETNDNDETTISCQKSLFKLRGLDANDYPRPTEIAYDWSFSMPATELLRSISKVGYARSTDIQRQILNGVLFSVRGEMLSIVATDGRRLALVEKPLVLSPDANKENMDGDMILPPKCLAAMRMLETDGDVEIRISATAAVFVTAETTISSRLVEGAYPNYRQVIPTQFDHHITIPRTQLAEVLRRVSHVLKDKERSLHIALTENLFTVSASSEVGEASEPLDIEYAEAPLELILNTDFLQAPIKELDCDSIHVYFSNDLDPVKLTDDEGFLYILMPLRG